MFKKHLSISILESNFKADYCIHTIAQLEAFKYVAILMTTLLFLGKLKNDQYHSLFLASMPLRSIVGFSNVDDDLYATNINLYIDGTGQSCHLISKLAYLSRVTVMC